MNPASMSAARTGLLGELFPDILNASTDFMNGSDINMEELMKLKPDVVIYSAGSKELGEALRAAGFAAVGISVNKWDYDSIETYDQWIALLRSLLYAYKGMPFFVSQTIKQRTEGFKRRSPSSYECIASYTHITRISSFSIINFYLFL